MPTFSRPLTPALALAALAACGGGSTSPSAPVLSVGGSYQVTPSVLQSLCGDVQVLPGPATVTQTPGSPDFTLAHAGQTYSGGVDRRGLFQTSPRVITFGNGSTDTVSINGAFSTTGFEATVTVDTNHTGAPPCQYTVRWVAAKQGAPNVFP